VSPDDIPDERRLKLIFHLLVTRPLAKRSSGCADAPKHWAGLTTPEIASAFPGSAGNDGPAIGAGQSAKSAMRGSPMKCPAAGLDSPNGWTRCYPSYLIFNAGYNPRPSGDDLIRHRPVR